MHTWDDPNACLFERFRPSQEGSLRARFLVMKQEGSAAEFRKKFETYVALMLSNLTEEIFESTFLNGLCMAIRAKVISRRPQWLEEMMHQAQLIEDRGMAIRLNRIDNGKVPASSMGKTATTHGSERTTEGLQSITVPEKSRMGHKALPPRRLSDAEFQGKREKGAAGGRLWRNRVEATGNRGGRNR